MRYGFCTGFAASMSGPIDHPLLDAIAAAGYDFVEFPLMQTAALSDAAFDTLLAHLSRLRLAADCTCNLFPPSLRLTGPTFDRDAVAAYLAHAFARLHRLGTRKVVFGSTGARNLPTGADPEAGYRRLATLTGELIVPLLERYDMLLAVEPIRNGESNFICTLADGMALVRRVNHPRVRLLADTIHMLCEHESPDELSRFSPSLLHVHVSEDGRALPAHRYSPALHSLLDRLRALRYDGTVSFETGPAAPADMAASLDLLKRTLQA